MLRDPEVFDQLLLRFFREGRNYYAVVYGRILKAGWDARPYNQRAILQATLLGYMDETKNQILSSGEGRQESIEEPPAGCLELYYQWMGDMFFVRQDTFYVFTPCDELPSNAVLIGGLEVLWDVRLNEIVGSDPLDQETLERLAEEEKV